MSSQRARVCALLPIIIVSDDSVIHGSNNTGTDILFSGTKLKELKIPVYCDIIIGDGEIKNVEEPCPINPYIKVLHISRLHVRLASIEGGKFRDKMKIETEDGTVAKNSLIISIGHGDKTDNENKKYYHNLYNDVNTSVKNGEVIKIVEAAKLEAVNIIEVAKLEMAKIAEIEATKLAEAAIPSAPTNKISPEISSALEVVARNFSTIQSDPELRKCMESIQYLTQSNNTKIELRNAINTLRLYLA